MQINESFNVKENLSKDFSYSGGKILSSMNCEADPFALEVFRSNVEKNLGDPALFPGTIAVETRVINILGSLFDLPSSGTGVILSGGSEANLTALWAIRNNNASSHNQQKPEIIAPESVHISIDKAADLLQLKLIKIPTTPQYQADLEAISDAISKKTIALIGVAGTTAFGTIDPLKELDDICQTYELDLHIDAAFGGLIFPFLPKIHSNFNLSFDDLQSLVSITVDIHKMGRVPIPGGGLLWRDATYPIAIQFTLPYLAGKPKQITITGTRTGASAIAFASLWEKNGFQGFQETVMSCLENTRYLSVELEKRGLLIPIKPVINILGVTTPSDFPFNVLELHKILWQHGWTTTIVNGRLRFVVMPSTTKNQLRNLIFLIDQLISDG
ncbi:MAG: tyrosine decarboxylase MfnA [Candidatus Heimdallarchaeota archaeon]|nr:MAG: tyrosine decarboxylase MfnA [Candidatus Heimdallarchaeota archaeon]